MLYREIIAVCSQIHTKHINTLCGQNVVFVAIKIAGTHINHWALKSYGDSCPLSLMFFRPTKSGESLQLQTIATHKNTKFAHINDLHLLHLFGARYRIVIQ